MKKDQPPVTTSDLRLAQSGRAARRRVRQAGGAPQVLHPRHVPVSEWRGLHVGHPLGCVATDVYARYLRMTGHHVLHTFGSDAFGLPAEQHAIDTGQHPEVTTRANIDNMRRQLRRLGLGHDTRREISTAEAGYYRWTQWIFLTMFGSWCDERTGQARPIEDLVAEFETGQRGTPDGRPWHELAQAQRRELIDGRRLACISAEAVNWCPGLGTVLANEEITAEGRSDVGNFPVYRRPLRQWMLRITAFADRLIDDLDGAHRADRRSGGSAARATSWPTLSPTSAAAMSRLPRSPKAPMAR
jgi:leucyl-tRNA synthetase